jgi:ADP-dependent NAD(P)H-hydrate dehydratase / NAD(P)H-hydrate epimerase
MASLEKDSGQGGFKQMKPVSVVQMRELDRRAMGEFGIPGIVLMENAGLRCADFITQWYGKCVFKKHIAIICGAGNNGGDGSVIARHLMNQGYAVKVFLAAEPERITGDARTNLDILRHMNADIHFMQSPAEIEYFQAAIAEADFLVDAIFGTGLDREITEPYAGYIKMMNESARPVVAIDCPSGLNCDTGRIWGIAVRAKYTLTMAAPKKGFYLQAGQTYTGDVHVIDISIPTIILEDVYD